VAERNKHINQRETNIRTIKLRGVPISISHQKGTLIIWGKPEYRNRRIEIHGKDELDYEATANFVQYKNQYAAIFNRLPPGNYWLEAVDIAIHGYEKLTITSNFATQLDWED